ncbi:MAG: DNA polymerase III subunit delta' [bacterium]
MPFSDIIGQERAVEILRRELSHGRASHAYLFSGMECIGKKQTALAFAMAVQCGQVPGDSCGECLSCRKIRQGIHPDVRLYVPEARTKGATEKIYIDQVRELQATIFLRAMEGKKKIFIIDDADRMMDHAANALLKTLEEPPPDSFLILVTAFPDLLPLTVLSRCRVVRFKPLSSSAVEEILVLKRGLSAEQAGTMARYSQGSLGRVLNAEAGDLVSQRDRFMELRQRWDPGSVGSVFEVSGGFEKKTNEAIDFMEFLVTWNRDLIAMKLTGDKGMLTHADNAPDLAGESGRKDLTDLLNHADILEEALRRLRMNINQRLALEAALIRMGNEAAV